MKRFFVSFFCFLSGAVVAQDFQQRAELGERVMATDIGDAYMDAIAPALHEAVQMCRKDGLRMKPGEAVTLVAQIAQASGLSPIEVAPQTAASECIAKQLQAAKLPLPEKWDWQDGDFPLTLRIGVGSGTVNGVREEG
jgi:hypothetical protein